MSDEDSNRSAFDLNPESQTLRTSEQTGQKNIDDMIVAPNFAKAQALIEAASARNQLHKAPVPADPDDKSDLYFIGKFVVSLWCYYHYEWKFISKRIES
jgi:hypothetical protein